MRFYLIPICYRIIIIRAVISMPVFDSYFNRFIKYNRRFRMIAIDRPLCAPIVTPILRVSIFTICKSGFGMSERTDTASTITPRSQVIIFCAGTMNFRFFLIIYKNHFIAFAPPITLILHYTVCNANIMTSSLRLKYNIIIFAGFVFFIVDVCITIILPIIGPPFSRSSLSVLSMEVSDIFG